MLNLIEIADHLKSYSNGQILSASQNPPPGVPPYLIAADMERRKQMQQAMQAQQVQQQAHQPPVMQQLQQSLASSPQGTPGQMTPQGAPPAPAGGLAAPMPQQPKMWKGGIVRAFGGLPENTDPTPEAAYDGPNSPESAPANVGGIPSAPAPGEGVTGNPYPFLGGDQSQSQATVPFPRQTGQPERLSERLRREAPPQPDLKEIIAKLKDAVGGEGDYSEHQRMLAAQLLHVRQQNPRVGDLMIRAGLAMAASPSIHLGQAIGQGGLAALDYQSQQKQHQQSEIQRIMGEQIALSRLQQGDRRNMGVEGLGMYRADQAARNAALKDATMEEGRENALTIADNKANQQGIMARFRQGATDQKNAPAPKETYYGIIDAAAPPNGAGPTGLAVAQQNKALKSMVDLGLLRGEPHAEIMKSIEPGINALRSAQVGLGKAQDLHVFNHNLAAGPATGASGPSSIEARAQDVIDGNVDPATWRSMIGPRGVKMYPGLYDAVKAKDPDFGMDKLVQKYNTLREFTNMSNTKPGGQVVAINTLIHHAQLMQEVGDALKNGSFKPGNWAYNKISEMFGGAAPNDAKLVSQFLASEAGKVATGGIPAQAEIHTLMERLGSDNSPEALKSAGQQIIRIMGGRALPLQETLKKTGLDHRMSVIGPDAADIMKKNGFDPDTLKPLATKVRRYNPATGKLE